MGDHPSHVVVGFHNPSCPESMDYDRRKTRTNWVECPSKNLVEGGEG